MKLLKKSLAVILFLSNCTVVVTWGQSFRGLSPLPNPDPLMLSCPGTKQQNNEFAYNGEPNGNFYCNPLVLEGVAFNYNDFTLASKGELKLVKGESNSGHAIEIPFYLYLRRDGIVITPCGEGLVHSKVELSSVLMGARDGDELIVEPANKEDWPAKRILKIGDRC